MDPEFDFAVLENAIVTPDFQPEGPRLRITARPEPFAAPTLHIRDAPQSNPFGAEVLLIQAPAAVGKSTIARFLSSTRRIPLLNLAEVPVSTGTLKSLITDVAGTIDPVHAFHKGQLPIIVDALDEGRLLSAETGFAHFLQTTGEFLLQDRLVTVRPKLIIFGRPESCMDAMIGLQLGGEGIKIHLIEVGFFAETQARHLIHAYAKSHAEANARYFQHPGPVADLVDSYFNAIERALGIERGHLWTDERGRAFAGYAPVLAALGLILGKADNFPQLVNALDAEGEREAWAVIERVLNQVLNREGERFRPKLAARIGAPVPAETYGIREQLTFLVRKLHGQQTAQSSCVELPPQQQAVYLSMVEQDIAEHPFLRGGQAGNAVLGSVILAHAIADDLLSDTDPRLLAEFSQQPFLWRSLSRMIQAVPALIDGRYVGYVLNSFWAGIHLVTAPHSGIGQESDKLTTSAFEPLSRPTVEVHSADDGAIIIGLYARGEPVRSIKTLPPITLYGQVRDCSLKIVGDVLMAGYATQPIFYSRGKVFLICSALDVTAKALDIDGNLWLEAGEVRTCPDLKIHLRRESQVGWGGQVAQSFPWNRVPSTVSPPYRVGKDDVLTAILDECVRRLPEGGALTLTDQYRVPDEDAGRSHIMHWAARDYPSAFPQLIRLLIRYGFASDSQRGAGGQTKRHVHLSSCWSELSKAARDPAFHNTSMRAFISEARATLDKP